MKRESRKRSHKRSYKRGGGNILAYPSSNLCRVNNLAYTGESQKGGTGGIIYYPKSNPPLLERGLGFIPGSIMKGGGCGCSKWFGGRKMTHKKRRSLSLKGGYVNYAGYPNGLVGSTWTANPETWPGVNGPGNNLAFNQYKVDPQTAMVQTNSNYPHNGATTNNLVIRGGKRGKRTKKTRRIRFRKGGSSILPQPITNLANNIQYNTESIYNRLNGIPAPVNPNPWKDQLI